MSTAATVAASFLEPGPAPSSPYTENAGGARLRRCLKPAISRTTKGGHHAIDAALPKAKLSSAQMSEVKKLRAEGERLHNEGKHAESMATLGKAKKLLGI